MHDALIHISRAFAALCFVILAGYYALNPLFRLLARVGGREILTAAVLFIVLGAAVVTESVGMSLDVRLVGAQFDLLAGAGLVDLGVKFVRLLRGADPTLIQPLLAKTQVRIIPACNCGAHRKGLTTPTPGQASGEELLLKAAHGA